MGNLVWKILGTGAPIIAANLARKGTQMGWEKTTRRKAPVSANAQDTNIKEAAAWALVSGAAIGVARMVAERQSAKYFTKSAGHSPEVYEQQA